MVLLDAFEKWKKVSFNLKENITRAPASTIAQYLSRTEKRMPFS